ncbi:MAG: diguanylate cyclase [Desulfatiglandaceae bacterium]
MDREKSSPQTGSEASHPGTMDCQDLIERAPCGMFTATSRGRLLYTNPAIPQMLGYEHPQELIDAVTNMGSQMYADPGDWKKVQQLLETNSQVRDYECRWVTREGVTLWVMVDAFTTEDPQGRLNRIQGYVRDISDKKQTEALLQSKAGALQERVKEQECLYRIFEISQQDISLRAALQQMVQAIPPGWQYPEMTAARIEYEGQVFQTERFRETPWIMTQKLYEAGKSVGAITVCYLEVHPQADSGPFLTEERNLLQTIAEYLVKFIEHQKTVEALRQSEAYNRSIIEVIPDIIIRTNAEGVYLDVIVSSEKKLVRPKQELLRRRIMEVIPERQATAFMNSVREALETQSLQVVEYDLDISSRHYWFEARILPVNEEEVVALIRDVTEEKRAQQALQKSEEKHRIVFESSPTAIWYEDAAAVKAFLDDIRSQGVENIKAHLDAHPDLIKTAAQKLKVLDLNPAALQLWEAQDKDEILSLETNFTPAQLQTFKNELCALAQGRTFFEEETTGKTLKGNTIHYIVRVALPAESHFETVLVTEQDITDRKKTELALADANRKLQSKARTDDLTGLLNHGAIMERLHQELNRGIREKQPLAFMMADLDHFKRINDAHGHTVGDEVLSGTAHHIQSACREYDIVGRYGGEEFAVILPGTSLEEAGKVAERIRSQVEQSTYPVHGNQITVTLSLGVSAVLEPKSQTEPQYLIKQADNALYKAKENGRNQVVMAEK